MHDRFNEWYRQARIKRDEEQLNKRWKGVEGITKQKDISIPEIVRLYFGLPKSEDGFISTFQNVFQKADKLFPMSRNKNELRVLAGAVIANLLDPARSENSNKVAFSTICANFENLRFKSFLPEILDCARDYLLKRSASLRDYGSDQESISPEVVKGVDSSVVDTALANNDIPGAVKSLVPELNSIINNLNQVTASNTRLNDLLKLQREEINIHWWLFGEFSNDLNISISEIEIPAACLVVGKELADLIHILPGPLAAEAFISKMLKNTGQDLPETITLKKAVNSSNKDWKANWMDRKEFKEYEDLCPVHFAVKKSLETTGTDDWTAAFENMSKLKVNVKLSPIKLALHVYYETLLINNY